MAGVKDGICPKENMVLLPCTNEEKERKNDMENFEIIDEREGHIRDRGYSLVHGAEMHYDHALADKLSNDYGENMVNNLIDSFYDGWNKICKGDDGKLYAVDFRYAYDEFAPFIWQEAKVA